MERKSEENRFIWQQLTYVSNLRPKPLLVKG